MLGNKDTEGKARWDLMPPQALEAIAKVFTYGSKKYGDRNWEKGMEWGKLFAAAQRHLWAFWDGQDLDEESQLPHLAHAAWNVLALLTYQLKYLGIDDRPKIIKPMDNLFVPTTPAYKNPDYQTTQKGQADAQIYLGGGGG